MSTLKAVRSRALTTSTGSTTAAVNFPPDIEAGDTLLLFCSGESNGTDTFASTGWTAIAAAIGGGTGITFQAFEKDDPAAGSETGTFNVTVNSSALEYSFMTVAVANPNGAAELTSATGTSVNPDSPVITPTGGSQHYAVFSVVSFDFLASDAIVGWPDGYDEWAALSANTQILISSETEGVGTSFDPGAYTMSTSDGWAAATIAVPCTAPADGFPTVVGSPATSLWEVDAATQSMNLPADIQAEELLLAAISTDDAVTASIAGWTELGTEVNGAVVRSTLLYKEATGAEGASVTVTLGASNSGSAYCVRIDDYTLDNIEAAFATGNSVTITFPAFTPAGGSDSITWLVGYSADDNNRPYGLSVNYAADCDIVIPAGTASSVTASGFRAYAATGITPTSTRAASTAEEFVSFAAAIYPAAAVPAAPTNPAAVAQSSSVIRVTWDDVADETGYRVERSDDGIGGWADVSGNLAADTVLYDDAGLSASTEFFYRVIAFNANGDSDPSSTVNATTDAAAGGGNRMGGTGAIRRAGRPQPARGGMPSRSQPTNTPARQPRQPRRPWLPPRSN